jgi:uncharacterized protein YhhL (DUF1145 family)
MILTIALCVETKWAFFGLIYSTSFFKSHLKMNKTPYIIGIILLFLHGLSALVGGGELIYDPSGKILNLSVEMLEHSPFDNFLIPGIILIVVNGMFNIFSAIWCLLKRDGYPWLMIACGVLLIVWIVIQIIMIRQFYPPLHSPYLLAGITIIVCGGIIQKSPEQ